MTEQTDAERSPYPEVWLHGLSPLPPVLNGLLISALIYAVYLVYSVEVGQAVIEQAGAGVRFNSAAWAALVICMITGVATTMPAITQRQWQASLPQLKAVLDEAGGRQVEAMAKGPTRQHAWRSLLVFLAGAVGGLLVNMWLLNPPEITWDQYWGTISPFFAIMNALVFGLAARGGYMVRYEDREMRQLVENHLQVDLAHLERNQIFGRLALRGALAWLVMTAVILLLFVDSTPAPISATALVLALIASGYAFASTIGPVVRKCALVRDAALQAVREQITASGDAVLKGAPKGAPVSELIAYETWLEKLPVWPISAPVTRRLALYGFIPVLAWFGSAAAELVLNRFT
ncbi:hypothetical protein ACFELO_13765 [Oceanicaulis sp. LC35]|uniref:hypothetical protein n=1 Tax=Oceanicaulis sp. LC35 TaxID=3349635 RepID=UPI003F84F7FD